MVNPNRAGARVTYKQSKSTNTLYQTRHSLILQHYQQDMVLPEETETALKFRHAHSIVEHKILVPPFISCLTAPATTSLVILETLQIKFSLVCH